MKKILIVILFLILPVYVQAGELRLTSETEGSLIRVAVSLETQGETINALSGAVRIPSTLSFVEAWYGDSLVPLWLEQPKERDAGTVSFSAIFPGGFNSNTSLVQGKGNIVTLLFRGTKKGDGVISFLDTTLAYANDGEGTPVPLVHKPLTLTVTAVDGTATLPEDNIPPETFIPTIVSGTSFGEDGRMLVFAAHDKGSGVVRYEIAKTPILGIPLFWSKVKSPYHLSWMDSAMFIYVRAVDAHENKTTGRGVSGGFAAQILFTLILIGLCFLVSRLIERAIIQK